MGKYIVRRLLQFIPTLLIITLAAFSLNQMAPGDPALRTIGLVDGNGQYTTRGQQNIDIRQLRTDYGLDVPLFYFHLNAWSACDTIQKIANNERRKYLETLSRLCGNWKSVADYEAANTRFIELVQKVQSTSQNLVESTELNRFLKAYWKSENQLFEQTDMTVLNQSFPYQIETKGSPLKEAWIDVRDKWMAMEGNATRYKNYIPTVNFNASNQYHRWLFGYSNTKIQSKGVLRGDFGMSYLGFQSINDILKSRLFWSVWMSLVAIIIAYLISIPIGLYAAVAKGRSFDNWSGVVLYAMYSMPAFWFAVLLMMTFANSDMLNWFPSAGVKPILGYPDDSTWVEQFWFSLPYLVLPSIVYIYASFAFVSRIIRQSAVEILETDYIRTARAKGVSEYQVVSKHVLKNALLPIITLFSDVFPLMVSGTVLTEVIFSIPGIGSAVFQAVYNKDFPLIVAVFLITGVFTLIGYLIADILYAYVDPRIRFGKK